jgi:hypothetical protein
LFVAQVPQNINTPPPKQQHTLAHPKNVYAFQQNIFTARVVHGQAPEAKDVVQQTMRDDESGRERLAENNRRKRRRDEEISVERSPTGGYSRHVWLCRRGGKDYIYACTFYAAVVFIYQTLPKLVVRL